MRKIATTHGVSYAALVAGAAWISLAGEPVSAQEAAPAVAAAHDAGVQQPAASSDDIVVTARRRSEPLQRVPLAVSVIQAETLSSNGIDSIADLPLVAPTLTSTPSPGGGRSSPNFAIRGLSQQELSILGDQSVSAYVGDVVIARVQGVNGALYDIGSIEVLRGPQGTLFGRNTTGGAVVIRPNRPTDRFEGKIGVSLGSFGTFNTEAMLNLPIGDSASLRIAGRTLHDDGYVYDQLLGRNVNFTKQFAGRVQLLLKPGSRFESLTSYEIFHENDGGVGAYLDQVNGAAANNAPAFRAARGYRPLETLLAEQRSRDIYTIASGTPAHVKIDTHLISNTSSYEFSDNLTLKNVIAYRHVKDDLLDDLDGSESAIFPQQRIDRSRQFSEELQLIGSYQRFDWIAGLYFFRESGRLTAYSASNAVDPGAIEYGRVTDYPDAGLSLTDVEGRNTSYAAFAQGTYEILDGLRLTAGLRYTVDERESIIRNRFPRGACRFTIDADNDPATPEVTPPLSQCQVNSNRKFSEPTYNLSLDYRFGPNQLVYIATRHGYRSGGFGSRATTQAGLDRTYDPETVDDIEIGFKADWQLGGGAFLRTNLAAYRADYKDIQRVLTDATIVPVQAVTVNAGNARIEGIEAEALLRPVPWLQLTANYAFTDARFIRFVTPAGVDLSDTPFARAPRNVYTLGARITPPLPSGSGELSLGGSYYSHDSYNADDAYVAGVTEMPSFKLVNLDVSWNRIMGSNFDVSASVTNVGNEKYSYYVANLLGLGVLPKFAAEPRRFTFTMRYHFGR